MTLPTYEALMAPLLAQLGDGEPQHIRDIRDALSSRLGLEGSELTAMLPSGRITVWQSRVNWAAQYLLQAGALSRKRRGTYAITERGRQLLAEHPDRVGNDELM